MNLHPQQPSLMASFGHKNWMTEDEMKAAAAAMDLPSDRSSLRRIARANAILFHGLVKATALDYLYKVKSQFKQDRTYLVIQLEEGYQCTCPDFSKRQPLPCKHSIAVQAYQTLVDLAYREEVVEAFDPDGRYCRFVRMYPPSTNRPSLEVRDV